MKGNVTAMCHPAFKAKIACALRDASDIAKPGQHGSAYIHNRKGDVVMRCDVYVRADAANSVTEYRFWGDNCKDITDAVRTAWFRGVRYSV